MTYLTSQDDYESLLIEINNLYALSTYDTRKATILYRALANQYKKAKQEIELKISKVGKYSD